MKIKILLTALIIFLISAIAFSQNLSISPKKVIYQRKDVPDYRKEFEVIYPIIKGKLNSKVKRKINFLIDYEKNFDFSIKDEVEKSTRLSECYYQIKYNKNYILDILLVSEGLGAYPWTSEKELLINLKTGKIIAAKDVFKNSSFKSLLVKIRRKMRVEINRAIKTEGMFSEFETAKFYKENLNDFSISDKGITFYYDYEFPFVVLASEPAGKFFFPYKELKPFIKRDGLLGKFVK
jgi:hypothetical protein